MTVYRRLSPFERIYFSVAPHFPPFAIQLLIEGDAPPSAAALSEALAQARHAHPLAGMGPSARGWVSKAAPSALEEAEGEVRLDNPIFHRPFHLDAPPLEIVRWADAGVLFRCSHALMDAGGLFFFAAEVFRALRGDALLGPSIASADIDYLRAFQHPRRRGWPHPNRASPLGHPTRDKAGFVWERRSLAGRPVSAGSRLAFALGSRAAKLDPAGRARVMVPVDLRQVDPELRTIANFSNPLFLELTSATQWPEFYRNLLQALARHDERGTEWLDHVIEYLPTRLIGTLQRHEHDRHVRNNRYVLSAVVSHLGRVSLAAFRAHGFEPRRACLLPFDAPSTAVSLLTVQTEDALEISASAPAVTGADGKLARLLDQLCDELRLDTQGNTQAAVVSSHSLSGPRPEIAEGDTVVSLFLTQVERTPDAAALSEGESAFTYRALERWSAAWAARLSRFGDMAGARVALVGLRTAEVVAAMLGVLRAGAAFVPLDPEWPQARLQFVLDDCRPVCVVGPTGFACDNIALLPLGDSEWGHEFTAQLPLPSQDTPAYVLYTSGSTGQPKGVMIGHASLANYLAAARELYFTPLGQPPVFALFTSLAFDLTLTALLGPLAVGGEVRAYSESVPLMAVRTILTERRTNAVKLTPSHLRLFREIGMRQSGLCLFVVGGEALDVELAAAVNAQLPEALIFNEYGPTEATVGCVVHRFSAADASGSHVPIGRPIRHTEVLLLSDDQGPPTSGDVGEIHLGGRCLALGYLGRPDENARFCANPLRPGERVYRTGDRARIGPDGLLHYLGRADDQVKVLGHRVELGEIEAALLASGQCREAAVVLRSGRLEAFVVWRGEHRETELRKHLAATLPRWAVPGHIAALASLPLSQNGKIDKKRLPTTRSLAGSNARQADSLQASLAAIAAELTGRTTAELPTERSLLDCGLDSLQMALLLTRASLLLPEDARATLFDRLDDVLQQPTLQRLAEHLASLGASAA